MSPADAAAQVGIATSTLYVHIGAKVFATPSKASKRLPSKAKGGSPKARPRAPSQVVEEDLDDVPGEVAGAADDVAAFDALIRTVEQKLRKAPDARVGSLSATLAGLIVRRAKIRPAPPKSAEELEQEARPLADEVLELIEASIKSAEAELGLT